LLCVDNLIETIVINLIENDVVTFNFLNHFCFLRNKSNVLLFDHNYHLISIGEVHKVND
jgi:hypothetical protein